MDYTTKFPQATTNLTQQVNTALAFDDDVFLNRLEESYTPTRFGSFYLYEANKDTLKFQAALFMNITSQDVSAIYP
jgi:hypothetical protein